MAICFPDGHTNDPIVPGVLSMKEKEPYHYRCKDNDHPFDDGLGKRGAKYVAQRIHTCRHTHTPNDTGQHVSLVGGGKVAPQIDNNMYELEWMPFPVVPYSGGGSGQRKCEVDGCFLGAC